jgi:hypothetical protein
MEQISELISGSKSGVELVKVLIEDSRSRDQLENGRRKFKEGWCKVLPWQKFNCTTGVAIREHCAYFPNTSNQNSNTVKGFAWPFKLVTFKKHANCFNVKNV